MRVSHSRPCMVISVTNDDNQRYESTTMDGASQKIDTVFVLDG